MKAVKLETGDYMRETKALGSMRPYHMLGPWKIFVDWGEKRKGWINKIMNYYWTSFTD